MTSDTDTGIGLLLGDRYQLRQRIAAGGMGEVWSATDLVLGRQVAVKVLRREYAEDPTFLERFRAEGRNTAALSHSGIAAVFDFSNGAAASAPDGASHSPYLVMELVPGEPLSAVIARDGALSPKRTLQIVGHTALALQAAHDAGVIHRDVKPGNILLTPDGTVKITDFGISRATNAVPLTQTGAIMGTAFYISPEQASGRPVTPASDLYSLGVVAYECLTGQRPFAGDTPVGVALAQVRDEPPALDASVDPTVAALIMRLLAKDPAQRPASAGELGREALRLSQSVGAAATRALPVSDDTVPAAGVGPASAPGDGGRGMSTDTDPGFRLPPVARRHGWLPYAVGLGAVGLLLVLALRGCAGDADETRVTGAAASASSTTETAEAVQVRASDYVGQPFWRARAALRLKGLQVAVRPVRADHGRRVGTVTGVSPTGLLNRQEPVTLDVALLDGSGRDKGHGAADERGRGPGQPDKPGKRDKHSKDKKEGDD